MIRRRPLAACGKPLRRRTQLRRRARVGAAARRRIRAGGVLATGRPAETLAGWRAVKAAVWARAGGRCEYHQTHRGTEYHHVVARSHGGADSVENVVLLCRTAHAQVSAPYANGRLVVVPLGAGRFRFTVLVAADKWAARRLARDAG